MNHPWAHPVLSCAETKALEQRLFGGDESLEWQAMQRAGQAVARSILGGFREIGGFPHTGRVLVLVGKGHNGGDALIAADAILSRYPAAAADVLLVYVSSSLRPLAQRAWRDLMQRHAGRVQPRPVNALDRSYELSLDGVFGFQFRPPLDATATKALAAANALPVRMRVAVDLPSGLDSPGSFRADFTYGTGVLKREALECANAGRLRYLDLGFFQAGMPDAHDFVITAAVLASRQAWRDPRTEKRKQGHLFVLAGSRRYPGAALMAVTAALRSGAGLVSAFVPESLVPAFSAQVPEAIWVGWPETTDGGLALEGIHLWRERLNQAAALVVGPGIGREPETLALVSEILKAAAVPVMVDADALQPEVLASAQSQLVLTPHAGEFKRIAGEKSLSDYVSETGAVVALKGPVTRVCAGGPVYHSLFGGPVLARGGSGDLLAGIVGAQIAHRPTELLAAVFCGVAWHGRAADELARTRGAEAVHTTQLLDFLPAALKLEP